MPPPKKPSRIEPLSFPVFGISWFSEPAEGGTSIYAYCGGGGSAKTGVNNSLVVFGENECGPRQIPTGDQAGCAVKIYQNPLTHKLWALVALGNTLRRYAINVSQEEADQERFDEVCIGEESSICIAVNSMASQFAVGCESGKVLWFETADDKFVATGNDPLFTQHEHKSAVCAMDFAARKVSKLISSSKDGCACVYVDGVFIGGLRCTITPDPKQPKPKRPQPVLVRGCAFGDMEGRTMYTVASSRRGTANLAMWEEIREGGRVKYACRDKIPCSDCPISAMALSADLTLLTMGSVEGDVLLWDVEKWKMIQKFKEVHHLPVTCIAARPFPSLPGFLKGEDDGVMIHARSASADSQLGCLTTQRRAARGKNAQSANDDEASFLSCSTLILWIHRLLVLYILCLIFAPVLDEARVKCSEVWGDVGHLQKLGACLLNDVLIAPNTRPGVSVPPY